MLAAKMQTGAGAHGPPQAQRPQGWRSSISCRRNGNLSIAATISRTSHGSGLRMTGLRSFSISTRLNPRGRSFCRMADFAAGSVSTITITSRWSSAGRSRSISCIWRMKVGSAGLSAKTTTGRRRNISSSSTTSAAAIGPTAGVSCAAGSTGAGAFSAQSGTGTSNNRTRVYSVFMAPPPQI